MCHTENMTYTLHIHKIYIYILTHTHTHTHTVNVRACVCACVVARTDYNILWVCVWGGCRDDNGLACVRA